MESIILVPTPKLINSLALSLSLPHDFRLVEKPLFVLLLFTPPVFTSDTATMDNRFPNRWTNRATIDLVLRSMIVHHRSYVCVCGYAVTRGEGSKDPRIERMLL